MDALKTINSKIMTLPNRPLFMLDSDVAGLYETETKYINRAVKRNAERFPVDFCFQLTDIECKKLEKTGVKLEVTDCDLKINYGGRRYRPFGFTHEGCNMLAAVLNTSIAIERSIQIIRAFTALERLGTQKAASDAPDSPILPSGLQLVMLKDLYGSEGLKEILKIHYGISPGTPITGITELEAHTIRKANPNQKQRNKMIAESI
ncbi:MAG: ORF6N domain-containing protein [Nitrospirae bacterium]|nr:ORF6N domain-containing protein [Nitrospirota bacterium]